MRLASLQARYAVEYDYEYVTNCEEAGCDSICRCGRYENLRTTSVNLEGLIEVQKQTGGKRLRFVHDTASTIEMYCIDRLLRLHKAYEPEKFSISVTGGYYGEEIDDITFEGAHDLLPAINEILNLESDLQKIRKVLEAEYSFVLDVINECKNVEIEELALDGLVGNDEYMRAKRGTQYEFAAGIPVGVVHRRPDGSPRLIDGYHRFAALLARGDKTAKYIVLS
jgi:hypothetical protein